MSAQAEKRPFVSIADEEWEAMKAANVTWEDVKRDFSTPEWCTDPGVLDGMLGCNSLTARLIKCRADCIGCTESVDYKS